MSVRVGRPTNAMHRRPAQLSNNQFHAIRAAVYRTLIISTRRVNPKHPHCKSSVPHHRQYNGKYYDWCESAAAYFKRATIQPTNKPARERRALIEWHAFCSVSKFAAKRVSTLFRHFSINHFARRVGRDKGLFLTHAAHTPECKIDWTKKRLCNKWL